MKYLLETVDTIEAGVGFAPFDVCHMTWLGSFVLFTLICCLFYRRMGQRSRRRMRIAMAAAIIADEGLKVATLLLGGNYSYDYLPLHLCSINLFLIAWHAFRPSKVLDNYLYAVCVPAAMAPLIFPNWTELPPTSLMHIHSFTFHMLLACYPVMLLAGGDIRPQVRALPGVVLLLGCLAGVAAIANKILGTNFMFLSNAAEGNPLYWFEEHWGNHLWGFAVLAPLLIIGMYVPELLRACRKLWFSGRLGSHH